MSAVLRYLGAMLPAMLIAAPVHLGVRAVILKKSKRKAEPLRELALFLFVIFLAGLFSQTVIPEYEILSDGIRLVTGRVHKTNLIPFKVIWETWHELFENGNVRYFIINFLGNILIFIPFGLLFPFIWRTSGRRVILFGLATSLFIECAQLFLARGSDVDDLLLNTLGTAMGFGVFRLLQGLRALNVYKG